MDKSPTEWARHWSTEMEAAHKRLRQFLNQGNKVVERYLDERKGMDREFHADSRLNLFYTNVSALQSMLYGSTPRIEVSREHNDPDDDVARVASQIIKRILDAEINSSCESLSSTLKSCLQDRLLPGLGVARVRYEMKTKTEVVNDAITGEETEVEVFVSEDAPVDYVHWQDYRWGWARTWAEIPWMAYRAYLSKQEVKDRFGEKIAGQLEYKKQTPQADDNMGSSDQRSNVQKAEIWEIWCKKSKNVFWWADGAPAVLDMQDDPLKLRGFWPSPQPLMANCTTTLFIPRADFILAQDLYNEVDVLQSRIAVITRAIKVVGVYDQSAGASVGRMLKEGVENDLIPVDNWAMFAEKGGLRGSIDWFPVETVVGVLQTLQAVQQTKIQQLYEVTGLSDVMRGGNTDQYTAAATQGMKMKMGSIRVQALQDEFARFASDIEELKAEVIVKHFDKQTIAQQAGIQFLGQYDQPYVMQAMQLLKTPDLKWRVNIRPESIAMVDYAQLKSERSEFLMAMATYIQSAQAAAREIPGSIPMLISLMKYGMAGFKGANELEGAMDAALQAAVQAEQQPQQDQGPSPEQMKMQMEQMKQQAAMQKAQLDLQKIQMKSQADLASINAKLQGELSKITADQQADLTVEQQRAQHRLMEISRALEADITKIQAQMDADLTIEEAQARFDIASQQEQHQNNLVELNAQRRTI